MLIRKAEMADFNKISDIFDNAREYMRKNGNMKQWSDGYPYPSIIDEDIQKGACHVCVDENEIIGVFSLFDGPDITYGRIIGQWPNVEPYGVIHRIAVNSNRKGVASECVKFALARYKNLRIYTHEDNVPMRSFLKKHGFIECGIIFLVNGEERIAYHKSNASACSIIKV